MIGKLRSEKVLKFLEENRDTNPDQLVFSGKEIDGVPVRELAIQVKARQKAKAKIREWAENPNVFYPSTKAVEQCSSETTGVYKSRFVQGGNLIDITGGLGVDSYYMGQQAEHVTYLERNHTTAAYAAHNFSVLGMEKITAFDQSAKEFLSSYEGKRFDLLYADPDRRHEGSRIIRIEESSPNLAELMSLINEKSDRWLFKLSPMYEITELPKVFQGLREIHILGIRNEVKELLVYGAASRSSNIEIICEDPGYGMNFRFDLKDRFADLQRYTEPAQYLYEPNAAIMKSGALNLLASRFKIGKLARNTHLYTSSTLLRDFPGRKRKIIGVTRPRIKAIMEIIGKEGAALTLRNFPGDAESLRKKWKLPQGERFHIYLTTLPGDNRVAMVTESVI